MSIAVYGQAYAKHVQGRKAGLSDTQKYTKTLSPQEVFTFTAGATMSGKTNRHHSTFHAHVMGDNVLAWADTGGSAPLRSALEAELVCNA
jgi:hypothetical protein